MEYEEYSILLYYKEDTESFFVFNFNLTSFDQSRTSFNINFYPFKIDFSDMTCDTALNQLQFNNVLLNCDYSPNRLKCQLKNEEDLNMLSIGDYTLYKITSESFFDVKLIKCEKPNDRINSALEQCFPSCQLEYEKECVDECPFGTVNVNNFCMNDFKIRNDDDNTITLEGDFEELKKVFMDNIERFAEFGKSIVIGDLVLQIYSTKQPLVNYDYSSLDFSDCEEAIRSSIPSIADEPLYLIKVDSFSDESITPDVSFKAYTANGEEIDDSIYEGVNVTVSYPINENVLSLASAEKMFNQGIDAFNASDSFFNDLCYPYSTENGTDVITKDRRNDLFQNVSFCDSNCVYNGINYTTRQVQCNCTMTNNESFTLEDDSKSFDVGFILDSNIAVVKCFRSLSKIKATNIGVWSCIFCLLNTSICCIIFIVKDIIHFKSVLYNNLSNIPMNNPPNQEYYAEILSTNEHLNGDSIPNSNALYHKKVVGLPHELDNLPYHQAFSSDSRSIVDMFIHFTLDKGDIFKLCCPDSQFDIVSINLSIFVFSLALNFTLNALFYTDDQLSSRYEKGELSFLEDLLRSIPASLIETIIGSIFKSFMAFPPLLEMLVVEVKTKKLILMMEKYYKSLVFKLIINFILQFILIFCFLYYLTLFCIIYNNSQVSWFTGCVYSFIIGLLTNIGIAAGLALTRFIGIKSQNKYIYNVELFVNNLI